MTGIEGARLRNFGREWFYPVFFALVMLIVALHHSRWSAWKESNPPRRRLGLVLDFVFVLTALTVAVTCLAEIEAVCLIDRITGDRARLMEQSLKPASELNALLAANTILTILIWYWYGADDVNKYR